MVTVSTPNNDNVKIGVIVIGRNEGQRLVASLKSLQATGAPIVYVDSGSTDGSVEFARKLGIVAVELDISIPFTAARARNAGFERLISIFPDLTYVQFIDGDCTISDGWLSYAKNFLDRNFHAALVCGRRREQHPELSIYNRLSDVEWDRPSGETEAFGGDALIRVSAFQAVSGFNSEIIAAEDDELCARLRLAGWSIQRVDRDMSTHDAAITRFSQWWRRAIRSGHGFAEVNRMHPGHFSGMPQRVVFWSIIIPTSALVVAPFNVWVAAAILMLYLLSFIKIVASQLKKGMNMETTIIYASSLIIVKFPNMIGMIKYYKRISFNESLQIIEYR